MSRPIKVGAKMLSGDIDDLYASEFLCDMIVVKDGKKYLKFSDSFIIPILDAQGNHIEQEEIH